MLKVIEGVGADAETITNARGGKQSKSPAALHLLDPFFLIETMQPSGLSYTTPLNSAIAAIGRYMRTLLDDELYMSLRGLEPSTPIRLLEIGKVLQYGATQGNNGKGYPINNWRLIPREEHINHALIHLIALLAGDTQDDHKGHAMCRLMMAIATKESEGFSYTKPFTEQDKTHES